MNKLKGRELFSDLMNRNHLDLIFGSRDRDYCTVKNLRYLLCCEQNILIKPFGKAEMFF